MNSSTPTSPRDTILVTGGAGYIGSVLVRHLLASGWRVVCIDRLDFGDHGIADLVPHPAFQLEMIDLKDSASVLRLLTSHRARAHGVVHLAAIVGDPACARQPEEAQRVNLDASLHLLQASVDLGIERFVFASTCSNYGKMDTPTGFVDEASPLAPVSLYAELKVAVERTVLESLPRLQSFVPTCLRFATVYGLSPRMRFDLTVNDFTKELALGRELQIFGEQFWRPYCHVSDFARAIAAVLRAPASQVAYEVFNVGDTDENYSKKMLANELLLQIPDAQIRYVKKDEDPRDYRVDFSKIRQTLDFEISQRVPAGIEETLSSIRSGFFSDPDHPRYYNVPPFSES